MARKKKKKSFESVESLKLEVDLGDEPDALRVLEGLLGDMVRAGGGDSGVLITSDRGHTRTHVYGVDAAAEQALRPLMEAAVNELTERGNPSSETEFKLRQQAGAPGIEYSFRYFQLVEGDIVLPRGIRPVRVVVRLLPASGAPVEQSFTWSAATAPAGG